MACCECKRAKTDGGRRHGDGRLPFGDRTSNAMARRVHEFRGDGLRVLSPARLYSGVCHGIGAVGPRVCYRWALDVFLSRPGSGSCRLWRRPEQRRYHAGACGRCDCLDCDRMDLRVVSSAERAEKLAASAIGGYALIGHPHALRQFPGLPEHIDRHAAPRIPVAADAQPFRPEQREQFLAYRDRAVFVKSAMITVAVEVELERF